MMLVLAWALTAVSIQCACGYVKNCTHESAIAKFVHHRTELELTLSKPSGLIPVFGVSSLDRA